MAKILRSLRILRMFKKFSTLRIIVSALGASMVPVLNTFSVLMITTAIFSIMGVSLFSELENENGVKFYEFSKFSSAFFTMFQCLTADAWASEVARPMFSQGEPWQMNDTLVAVFFILYMLIGYLVIMNLVLAVLIDEFLKAADQKRDSANFETQIGAARSFLFGPLDPVLEQLAHLYSDDELETRINVLFDFLRRHSDAIDFAGLRDGFADLTTPLPAAESPVLKRTYSDSTVTSKVEREKNIKLPAIKITEEDFREMTEDGHFIDADGCMDRHQVIHTYIHTYMHTHTYTHAHTYTHIHIHQVSCNPPPSSSSSLSPPSSFSSS